MSKLTERVFPPISLNQEVTVILTDEGREIYTAYIQQVVDGMPFKFARQRQEYYQWAMDSIADNRLTVPLWELFSLFGKSLCNGADFPFDKGFIYFDKNDCKKGNAAAGIN